MDHVALRLPGTQTWTYLGGKEEAKKPLEVVVRSYDAPVEIATGDDGTTPSADTILVPAGEGRRLEGRHFFARAAATGGSCRISYRGV